MKPTSVIVLIVACAFAFFAGEQCAGKPDPDAIRRADNLQLVLARYDSIMERHAFQDIARQDTIREAQDIISRLRSERVTSQLVTDTLVVAVVDSTLAEALQVSLIHERAISDSTISRQQTIIRLWASRYDDVIGERDNYRNLSLEYNRQLQAAVNRPTRSRLRPCVAAIYGTGGASVGAGLCYSL